MKKHFYLLILFVFAFPALRCFATHIVGGEMNYHYIANNQYEVTLTVYRDCFNGVPPFDNPAIIGVYDQSSNLVSTTQVFITHQQSVPNVINSPCLTPPTNVCYEVAQYIFTLTVPQAAIYTITYQRCCRNSSIANLANVQGTGATYMAVITNPVIAAVNSNPVFKHWPPTFICRNAPFTFDHSATDAEGDSLVYQLSYPFNGGSMSNAIPNPPQGPPYDSVVFLSPYSVSNPLGGIPMRINAHTGLLTATPAAQGQFVYGVSVKEFRNGIYLGETRRDFQVNVVPCPQITVASIYSPTIACGSLAADFQNNSFNAATYSWFFGDTTATDDTSSMKNPSYIYPDTGDYIATLIAYSGINPLCNDTATGIVHVYPNFITNFIASGIHCSNDYSFFDKSYGVNGFSDYWSWNFGDQTRSTVVNPVHTYATSGEYNVTLITSTDSSCTDTLTRKIYILQNPTSDFSLKLDTCNFSLKTKQLSHFAVAYRWSFGDETTFLGSETTHHYQNAGQYEVQLIVATDSSCIDTSSMMVTIPPLPDPDFKFQVAPCDSLVQFINLSDNSNSFMWEFGDYTVSHDNSPLHTFSLSGNIPVHLTAISQYGCKATLNKPIYFISYKKADFLAVPDTCNDLFSFKDLSNHAAYRYWDFGDGTSSEDLNPIHKYATEGEHTVTLYVNSQSACPDSMKQTIKYESAIGEKVFIPTSFTPNGDGINDYFKPSIFRPCEIYKITIFNRWGQQVFQSNDAATVNWDGDFAGEKLAQDVYVYILENDGQRREGILTILR